MLEANASAATRVPAADTDMLHRRVPLSYRFELAQGRSGLCIRTDSVMIGEVLRGLEEVLGPLGEAVHGEWEIAVEAHGENSAPLPAETISERFEVFRFGPSRSVRMADGSWFAHTPPSTNGAGFAMVKGDRCQQLRQLAAYLRAILLLVSDRGDASNPAAEWEAPE